MNEPDVSLWGPAFYPFWAFITFLFGLFFGSFLNVAIYRLPMGLSVNKPKRSFCYRCGSMIQWFDNLPIVSYLLLKGRCRACGSKYSPRYLMVELLTGVIWLGVFLGTNSPDAPFQIATIWYLAFASMLIVGTFTDFDHWIIPDEITVYGSIAAFISAIIIGFVDPWPLLSVFGPFPVIRIHWNDDGFFLFQNLLNGPRRLDLSPALGMWWEPLANAALGAVVSYFLLLGIGYFGKLIFRKEAMGFGDVKLFIMIGATLGITGSLVTLFIACLLGLVMGGYSWARRGDGERTRKVLRLGGRTEAESAAESTSIIAKLEAIDRHAPAKATLHHLPFGPAIAGGALIVIIFQQGIHDLLLKVFL